MLTLEQVHKSYARPYRFFGKEQQAVLKGVSLQVEKGECVGLVGESGSGKSTLGRLILGLESPCQGEVRMEGVPVAQWKKANPGRMSVVFQDYTTSINPGFTVARTVAEPLAVTSFPHPNPSRADIRAYVRELLERVELSGTMMDRYPHELSGGQIQRVCIARAIATRPGFILFDEALSALDVSVQAQVMKLLLDLKKDLHLTYLFIAHDLAAVTALCDRVVFLLGGEVVEVLATQELSCARTPYAGALLEAAGLFAGVD